VASTGSGSRIALFLVLLAAIFAGVFYGLDRARRVGSTSSPGPGSSSSPGVRPSSSSSSGSGRKSASGAHVVWGICAAPKCTGDLIGQESQLGRKFAVAKTYHSIAQPSMSPTDQQLVESGHSLLYSISPVQPSPGGRFSFDKLTDIAAGRYDSTALAQLKQLNGISTTPYVIFDGEPENILETRACSQPGNNAVCGPEFVAAWRHLHDLAQRNGLTRLRWVWNLTAKLYMDQPNDVGDYYPGPTYVDWMGVDPYNQDCGAKAADYARDTFAHLMALVLQWHDAHANSLPIALTEWGAPELAGDPNARADWLKGVAAYAKHRPAIQMMVYWDGGSSFSGCDFSIPPGTPSFAAFKAIGLDPYFERS